MAITIDYLVQENIDDEDDKEILHKKSCTVNMRLFRSSPVFRQIIFDVINYIDNHLDMHYSDGYNPQGISAVKLGIPWNIVGFKNKGKNKFCINPKIIRYSKDVVSSTTGCK